MYVTCIGSASRPSEPRASEPRRFHSEPSRAFVVARSWLGSRLGPLGSLPTLCNSNRVEESKKNSIWINYGLPNSSLNEVIKSHFICRVSHEIKLRSDEMIC